MKNVLLLFTLLATGFYANAQKIVGSAKMADNEPMIGANVALIKASDSSLLKYGYTEEDGSYVFESIDAGRYMIRIDDGGFATHYSAAFDYVAGSDVTIPSMIMELKKSELENVEITYRRPIVELKADMTVFNIDSTINAVGQDALDLMRKSPGVMVDKDENISLSGKNGVRVYIDGRPSPLTGTELSEFLKSIQSNSIDAIEIITSPSAKYDAQGNAGIINIRMKKNQNYGTNGSVSLGYTQGVFPKYNGGVTLNHRNGKYNVYGSYNGATGARWNDTRFERTLKDTFYRQTMNSVSQNVSHNYKAGVDYFLNDKSVFGAMVTGNIRNSDNSSVNNMDIIDRTTNNIARTTSANNTISSERSNINGNINYSYNDKKAGKSLTLDADYGIYDINTDQVQPNVYYNELGAVTGQSAFNIIAPTHINIFAVKADWEQNLGKGKLGIGTKFSFINTQNDFNYSKRAGSVWVQDTARSNDFNYNENIQAGYATYSQQFPGVAFQAGVRVENTVTTGQSLGLKDNGGGFQSYDSTFERSYFDYFPSIGFTFNKNPMSQFTLAYSKRIDRPNYQDLNPFEFRMDDYSYKRGNINLLPQITHNVSLTHSFMYMLNTKIEYSKVSNVFAELVDTAGSSMFQTKENLATQDMISMNVSFPYSYNKWSSFVNLNAYYSMYRADYGEGRDINLDVFAFNAYGQVSYKINSWLSAEMSGWYTSPSIWQGTFRSIAMGGIDAGAQARILQGKGTLRASVGDIFNTMQWGGSSDFVGQKVFATGRWESTQLRLNFTYSFGNTKVKSRTRNTGAEDEKSRTSESGGMGQGQ